MVFVDVDVAGGAGQGAAAFGDDLVDLVGQRRLHHRGPVGDLDDDLLTAVSHVRHFRHNVLLLPHCPVQSKPQPIIVHYPGRR